MSRLYRAVLIAPEGDWVTSYPRTSIEAVEEALANQGSNWYFYPFHAVIRDSFLGFRTSNQRLVSVAPPFEHFKGRTIKSLAKHIASIPEEDLAAIIGG